MKIFSAIFVAVLVLLGASAPAIAQDSHYDQVANTLSPAAIRTRNPLRPYRTNYSSSAACKVIYGPSPR